MHIVYESLPMHIVLNHIDSDSILYSQNGHWSVSYSFLKKLNLGGRYKPIISDTHYRRYSFYEVICCYART